MSSNQDWKIFLSDVYRHNTSIVDNNIIADGYHGFQMYYDENDQPIFIHCELKLDIHLVEGYMWCI